MQTSNIEDEFYYLLENLEKEVCIFSNTNKMIDNKHFKEMLNLGEDIIPLILKELKNRPSYLFYALMFITNVTHILRDYERGRVGVICNKWINWAKEMGINF